MFWLWIGVTILVVVGASVVVGRALNRPPRDRLSRHQQVTGLKASGALKHRKSNRE